MSNNKQNKVTEISESIFFGISHGKSTNEPTENDYVEQPLKNKIKIMSNNKQSSVEWFAEQTLNAFITKGKYDELFEQAKAMHKEEIKSAFDVGCDVYYNLNVPSNSEQYYNKTYGDNK